jgi:hypothetical protein
MRVINKHMSAFGRLFLLLFFLANSGYTVVLYHCTVTQCAMKDGMSGKACCTGKDDCTTESCEALAAPQGPVAPSVTVDQKCMTATIAGGNLHEPAIVEVKFNGQQILKADLLPTAIFGTAIGSRLDLPAFHLASSASNVFTSSVETYVLNATFLI